MQTIATSMSLFITLGYPVVAIVCVRILDLNLPKFRRQAIYAFLVLYLAACGLGTHADQFIHLWFGRSITPADLASPSHVGILFAQVVGISGLVGAVFASRARGLTLHIVDENAETPMSEAARYESEIERLKARAELLQDAVEGNAAAVIANRRMKHDLNNNITKVQGAVQVLAIRLASERKLTPDEERLVSMAERVPHL